MGHPDLPKEQAYVDHAYECLDRMRAGLERVGEAVDAPEYQAAWFEAWARKRIATFEDADRGLCFRRLDLDGVAEPIYVGRRWVHEENAPLVVNWQAPAARPFYTATVAEPLGVERRRRFRVDGRRLLDLYDEPLDGSAGEVVHGVADILLEELERSRDEHMRDIVATIQADQYKLITRDPEGVLIIQGGPGPRGCSTRTASSSAAPASSSSARIRSSWTTCRTCSQCSARTASSSARSTRWRTQLPRSCASCRPARRRTSARASTASTCT